MSNTKERRSRIAGVMDAIMNPQEAQGIEGVHARLFRLIAADIITSYDIDPSQFHLRARKLAEGLWDDPSRESSVQQELSNLLSAWMNAKMPFPRMVQGMGALSVESVGISMTVTMTDGQTFQRNLEVPVPIVVNMTEPDHNGYSIPVVHGEDVTAMDDATIHEEPA